MICLEVVGWKKRGRTPWNQLWQRLLRTWVTILNPWTSLIWNLGPFKLEIKKLMLMPWGSEGSQVPSSSLFAPAPGVVPCFGITCWRRNGSKINGSEKCVLFHLYMYVYTHIYMYIHILYVYIQIVVKKDCVSEGSWSAPAFVVMMWSPAEFRLRARSPSCHFLHRASIQMAYYELEFFSKEAQASGQQVNRWDPQTFVSRRTLWLCFGSGVKLSDNFLELGGESLLALRSGAAQKWSPQFCRFWAES